MALNASKGVRLMIMSKGVVRFWCSHFCKVGSLAERDNLFVALLPVIAALTFEEDVVWGSAKIFVTQSVNDSLQQELM